MDALSALLLGLRVCRNTNRSDDVAGQWTQAPSYYPDVSFPFPLSVLASVFMSLILFEAG
jgi:hypothetical protein